MPPPLRGLRSFSVPGEGVESLLGSLDPGSRLLSKRLVLLVAPVLLSDTALLQS